MSTDPKLRSRTFDRSILIIEALIGIGIVTALIGRNSGAAPTVFFVLCGVAAAYSGYALYKAVAALNDPSLEVTGRVPDHDRERLEQEKFLLLAGIKELEADAAVGKVDAADYKHLRHTAEVRALEIIQKLKKTDEGYLVRADALVAKKLGRPSTIPESEEVSQDTDRPDDSGGVTCRDCKTANDADAKFCIGCGHPLKESRA